MFGTLTQDRRTAKNAAGRIVAGLIFAGMVAGAPLAFAAGGSSGGGTSAGGSSGGGQGSKGSELKTDLTTCAKGQVWDAKNQKCIAKQSGVLPDHDLTEYAYALAKAERFQEAIDVLDALQDPNTPRALNYRGYATRKLGRTEEGIGYYLRSVALDPTYTQVREYLGEAYVTLGKFDLANEQLAMLDKLCGYRGCEEYGELAQAIRGGKTW